MLPAGAPARLNSQARIHPGAIRARALRPMDAYITQACSSGAAPAAAPRDAAERHEATQLMSRVLRGGDVPKLIDEVVFVFDEISGYSVSWSLQVLSAYGTSHIPCASNGSRVL